MGIDEGSAAKTAGSVYVVSVYRASPGHRDQLEKALSQTQPGGTSSGDVLMQHLEGGPWHYLTIARYNSWQDFVTNEKNSVPDTLKAGSGWLELRNHSTYHNEHHHGPYRPVVFGMTGTARKPGLSAGLLCWREQVLLEALIVNGAFSAWPSTRHVPTLN